MPEAFGVARGVPREEDTVPLATLSSTAASKSTIKTYLNRAQLMSQSGNVHGATWPMKAAYPYHLHALRHEAGSTLARWIRTTLLLKSRAFNCSLILLYESRTIHAKSR